MSQIAAVQLGVNDTIPRAKLNSTWRDDRDGVGLLYRYQLSGTNYRWELVGIDVQGQETIINFTRYADYNASNEFTLTTGAGTGTAAFSDDTRFGVLTLTNGSSDDDDVAIQYTDSDAPGGFLIPTANKAIYMESVVQVSDADVTEFIWGLTDPGDQSLWASAAIPTCNNFIGFISHAADANIDYGATKAGTADIDNDSGQDFADATRVRLAFVVYGTSSVEFFVNGVSVGSLPSANVPIVTTCMTVGLKNGSAVAHTCGIDYFRVIQEY